MNRAEVVKAIIGVLEELQSISGRPAAQISERTCPIGDLDEFDSLNGVEATVELSDRLGIDLPGVNAFVTEKGTKALTVSEVADAICRLTADKEISQ
jgi:acyl carrier protein